MALFSPNAALVLNTIEVLFGSNPNIPISLISYFGFQLENLKGMEVDPMEVPYKVP